MTSFHDVNFPLPLAFGISGGPEREINIIRLASGAEYRNNSLAHARRRYDVGAGIKSLDDVTKLIVFFEARMGQLYSFRLRDPLDFMSCQMGTDISPLDQILGKGDGVQTQFQLVKHYKDEADSYVRPITKPVVSTVIAAINGEQTDCQINPVTGRIDFVIPPLDGAEITAGYKFDVPVRFDTPQLSLTLQSFGAGQLTSIPLVEVIDYAPTVE